jgi:hypothetical protein
MISYMLTAMTARSLGHNEFVPFTVVVDRIFESPFDETLDSIAIKIEKS